MKKSISVVIAFTIMISMCIFAIFPASATNGCMFSAGDYIYVSVYDVQGIDINGKIKCHMYSDWPDNSGSYIDSVDMQKISDNFYRCHMMSDNVKYLKFKLKDSDWWISNWSDNYDNSNFSVVTNDQVNNYAGYTNGVANNCLYIKSSDAKSASWGLINSNDPDNKITSGTSKTLTANLSSEITSNVGKDAGQYTLVKGTFYDYYNNDERRNGWISGLDGSERSYVDREPFTFFNNAVAEYAKNNSAWQYPLYFGDFNRSSKDSGGPGPWGDGYVGAGISNLFNYKARANNSNMTSSGTNGAVSGLVDSALANGELTSGGVILPYFSNSFLEQGNGAIVNSQFVFRNELRTNSSNGTTDMYQVYDSSGAKDNYYFKNLTSGSPTAVYYKNSHSTYDAASGFGNSSNGTGFFPFDDPSLHNNNAYDFGFGMKLEIPFVLRQDGKTKNGNDVVFNFSGDDDLWVFIDGKLILDMGGAHKKATGSINFTDNTISVSSLDTSYGTKTQSISDIEDGKAHTMTVFYMERGMIESNLKIEYNFDVLDTLLTTEKEINTEKLNDGIVSTVQESESFDFINLNESSLIDDSLQDAIIDDVDFDITDKNGSVTDGKYNSDGSYTLKDCEKALFADIAESGTDLTVKETKTDSLISYSTKYEITDVQNNVTVKSELGDTASFKFQNTVDENQMANFNVKFVNTPKVSNLSVTKNAFECDGTTANTGDEFSFYIGLDMNSDGNYEQYSLAYKVGSVTKTATNGVFTLKGGETAVFSGIPVGVDYQIVEANNSDYTTVPANRTLLGTVESDASDNSVTFVNTKIDKSGAVVDIKATKLLDGVTPDVNTFEFTLTELTLNGSSFADNKVIQKVSNFGESVEFDSIKFDYEEPDTTAPVTVAPTEVPTQAPTEPSTEQPTTEPVDEKGIYFKPSSVWESTGNPRYAMYVFGTSGSAWASMWDDDGDGYHYAVIPDGTWEKVIFCRMNPDKTENSWSNKWNQTGDITLPIDGKNCFTFTDSAWNDGTTGSWSVFGAKSVRSVNMMSLKASAIEKHYYKISENCVANDSNYVYDETVYYVVVTVDRTVAPMTATAVYYKTTSDAINEINPISSPESDVVFNNYHKGSMQITKYGVANNDREALAAGVQFNLYKTSGDGGELGDIVETLEVDENGMVLFDNLDIFIDQETSGATKGYQWYCFVETTAADGYNINSTKYYFTVPLSTAGTLDKYDFKSNGNYYSYVLKNDKPIYHIECDVDNFPVVTPVTSGSGISIFIKIGLALFTVGGVLFVSYEIYDSSQRRKRKSRRKIVQD